MAQGFVHLHTHSSHSVRDSIARPDDLFDAVVADGQSALAITDHGNLSGLYVAHQSAAKRGVSLIGGIEAYMAIEDGSPTHDSVARLAASRSTTAMLPIPLNRGSRSTPTSRCWRRTRSASRT